MGLDRGLAVGDAERPRAVRIVGTPVELTHCFGSLLARQSSTASYFGSKPAASRFGSLSLGGRNGRSSDQPARQRPIPKGITSVFPFDIGCRDGEQLRLLTRTTPVESRLTSVNRDLAADPTPAPVGKRSATDASPYSGGSQISAGIEAPDRWSQPGKRRWAHSLR